MTKNKKTPLKISMSHFPKCFLINTPIYIMNSFYFAEFPNEITASIINNTIRTILQC